MTLKILPFLLLCLFTIKGYSQTLPFPQNRNYGNGLLPTNKNSSDASTAYSIWKTNFLAPCANGRFRVKFDDPSQTVSEGIAYGMLLSAYAGDKGTFDGLWLYYLDNKNTNGFMHWKIAGCTGILGSNGATDSDEDAAMALIVASYQWGSAGAVDYQAAAKLLISTIKSKEVESGTFILKPGDMFGGSSLTNPSYFAPGYYRAFGQFTNDASFWNSVASATYTVINKNLTSHNAVGGLVSDWTTGSGAYNGSAGYAYGGERYSYDASRTPWRIAIDYAWFGNSEAKAYIKKSSDFVRVNLGGSQNIKDGYNQNGTVTGQWHNSAFVGAFASAAIGGESQTHLDNSYADLKSINDANSYYNQSLKTLYLFFLTGNFYLPTAGAVPVTPPTPVTPPVATNISPTVKITSPAASATFTSGSNITITATASDADGSISKVDFYQGNTLLGSKLTSPYTYVWNNPVAGSYSLTTKATDNNGAVATSAPVAITISQVTTTPPVTSVPPVTSTPLPTTPVSGACFSALIPASANYVIRNNWSDQNNGSSLINGTEALQIKHRQWGQNNIWVIQNTPVIKVVAGRSYAIKFDFKDDAVYKISNLNVAFASAINFNGPSMAQTAVNVPSGYSSTAFTTKMVTLTSAISGNVNLALQLNWAGQPNVPVSTYIKNISVCEISGNARIGTEATVLQSENFESVGQISPNPFSETSSVMIATEESMPLQIKIFSLAGVFISESSHFTNQSITIGKDLPLGIYILEASFGPNKSTLKLIKD